MIRSGFSSEVELGRPGRITSSPTTMMRVRVRDRDDRSLGAPATPAVYLRGAVLEEYQNGRWSKSGLSRDDSRLRARSFDRGRALPIVSDSEPMVWTHEYEIEMDRPESLDGYVFSPWLPVELRMLESDALVSVDERTRTLRLMDERVRSYKVRVRGTRLEQFPAGVDTRGAVPEELRDSVPERVGSLAREILSGSGIAFDPDERPLGDDARAVRALEGYLRSTFAYTLDSEPVPRGRDATEWFLFDRRAGHCEYFASALALMCRASGIPSRVVTGLK